MSNTAGTRWLVTKRRAAEARKAQTSTAVADDPIRAMLPAHLAVDPAYVGVHCQTGASC